MNTTLALLLSHFGVGVTALAVGMMWEVWSRADGAPTRTWPQLRGDLGYTLLNIVVVTPACIFLLERLQPLIQVGHLAISPWVGLALAFFLFEGITYGLHRLYDVSPFFMRFHRVHHATGSLSCIVAFRMHPVDVFLFTFVGNLPTAILGIPVAGGIAVIIIERIYATLLHASAPFSAGPLKKLFASGHFHHVHHGRQGNHGHFGGALSIFDYLFGTVISRV